MINTFKFTPIAKIKATLALSALLTCTGAYAAISKLEPPGASLKHIDAPFKVAVIRDAIGTKGIVKGDYETSISDLTIKESDFEVQMGLCVANMKLGKYELADTACTKAIEYISSDELNTSRAVYLASIAYSNRGIVKHYLNDKAAAFKDFNMALSFDSNDVVLTNLKALNIATLKKEILLTATAMNH